MSVCHNRYDRNDRNNRYEQIDRYSYPPYLGGTPRPLIEPPKQEPPRTPPSPGRPREYL